MSCNRISKRKNLWLCPMSRGEKSMWWSVKSRVRSRREMLIVGGWVCLGSCAFKGLWYGVLLYMALIRNFKISGRHLTNTLLWYSLFCYWWGYISILIIILLLLGRYCVNLFSLIFLVIPFAIIYLLYVCL
jgi:hypothetical protein